MNQKSEINGHMSSAGRMLEGALEAAREAWSEGEVMLNPREYSELQGKISTCKRLLRSLEIEVKQFEPSASSRALPTTV